MCDNVTPSVWYSTKCFKGCFKSFGLQQTRMIFTLYLVDVAGVIDEITSIKAFYVRPYRFASQLKINIKWLSHQVIKSFDKKKTNNLIRIITTFNY